MVGAVAGALGCRATITRNNRRVASVLPRVIREQQKHPGASVCGLGGEFRFDGAPADRDALDRMSAVHGAARSRRARACGTTGPSALAHRRLAIIDLSATGAQPMVDADLRPGHGLQRLHLQLQQLRDELQRLRLPLLLHVRHRGDRQVLPPLGRPLRRPLLRHVRVRASWSSDTGRLILGRDRLGIKPLYLRADPRPAAIRLRRCPRCWPPGTSTPRSTRSR